MQASPLSRVAVSSPANGGASPGSPSGDNTPKMKAARIATAKAAAARAAAEAAAAAAAAAAAEAAALEAELEAEDEGVEEWHDGEDAPLQVDEPLHQASEPTAAQPGASSQSPGGAPLFNPGGASTETLLVADSSTDNGHAAGAAAAAAARAAAAAASSTTRTPGAAALSVNAAVSHRPAHPASSVSAPSSTSAASQPPRGSDGGASAARFSGRPTGVASDLATAVAANNTAGVKTACDAILAACSRGDASSPYRTSFVADGGVAQLLTWCSRSSDATSITAALSTLSTLCDEPADSESPGRDAAIALNAFATLAALLGGKATGAALLAACMSLRHVSRAPGAGAAAARCGAISALISMLADCSDDVAQAACGALANLCSSSDADGDDDSTPRGQAVSARGVEALCAVLSRALATAPPTAALAGDALAALVNLTSDCAAAQTAACSSRALDLATMAARCGVSIADADVAEHGCLLLANCAATSRRSGALSDSVLRACVAAVALIAQSDALSEEAAEAACNCLAKLAAADDAGDEDGAAAAPEQTSCALLVASSGGAAACVAALRVFRDSEIIAEAACDALCSMAADDGAAPVAAAQGAQAVCTALRQYGASSLGVAEAGCSALWNLTAHADAEEAAAAAGAAALACSSASVHGEASESVAQAALAALSNLAVSGGARRESVRAAGAGALAVRLLRVHGTSHVGVATHGCALLWGLAADEGAASSLATDGAASVFAACLRAHAAVHGVAEPACGGLAHLALDASGAGPAACLAAGATEALVHALTLAAPHAASDALARNVLDHAASALWALTGAEPAACVAAGSCGGVRGLCGALALADTPLGVEASAAALANVVCDVTTATEAQQCGAQRLLAAALVAWGPGSQSACEAVLRAILTLAVHSPSTDALAAMVTPGPGDVLTPTVTMANTHASCAEVQAACCALLCVLCSHPAAKAAVQQANNVMTFVLQALTAHGPGNEQVAEQACGVLAALTYDDDEAGNAKAMSAALLANFRAIAGAVVVAMRAHPGSDGVAEQGAACLWNLAAQQRSGGSDVVSSVGGLHALTAALAAHGDAEPVAALAAGALAELLLTPGGSVAMDSADRLAPSLVAAMRQHTQSIGLQRAGCALLARLAAQSAISDVGAASEAVCAALLACPFHTEVQIHGCSALARLTNANPQHTAGFEEEDELLGGSDLLPAIQWPPSAPAALAAALRSHPKIDVLQLAGCAALWRLASLPDMAAVANEAGAITAVCSTMRHRGGDARQQAACAGALARVACDEASRVAAAAAGAMSAVTTAMREFDSRPSVLAPCIAALAALCEGHAGNQAKASAAGAVEAVVAAMSTHPQDGSLQAAGCDVLSHLASNAIKKAKVVAARGVGAAAAALHLHGSNPGCARSACALLAALSYNDDSKAAITAVGGVDALLTALASHGAASPEVVAPAAQALAQLMTGGPVGVRGKDTISTVAARTDAADGQGVSSLVLALDAHGTRHEECAASCCTALAQLALNVKARKEARHEGAIPALLRAATAHSASARVQETAAQALAALLGRPSRGAEALRNGDVDASSSESQPTAGALVVRDAQAAAAASAQAQNGAHATPPAASANGETDGGDDAGDIDAACTSALQGGAINLLVSAAASHGVGHAACGEHVCAALSALCSGCTGGTAAIDVTSGGGAEAIVAVMRSHTASWPVQWTGADALHAMCEAAGSGAHGADASAQHARVLRRVADASACEALIGSMRAHPASAGVTTACCAAASSLVTGDDSAKRRASAGGLVEEVVASMRTHPNAPHLALFAAHLLRSFTARDGRLVEVTLSVATFAAAGTDAPVFVRCSHRVPALRALEAGAPEALAAALRRHGATSRRLAAFCCACIADLTGGVHAAPGRMASLDAGCCDAIVAAMRAHPAARDVQAAGCAALWNVAAVGGPAAAAVATAGGVDAVVAAMNAHAQEPGIAAAGAGIMAQLASHDDAQVKATACGGIDAVLACMKVHAQSPAVLRNCCEALAKLTADADAVVLVAHAGGIAAVLGAMRALPGYSGVQEPAVAALCYLACSDATSESALKAGAVDALVSAMRAQPDGGPVQDMGCQALGMIAQSGPDMQLSIAMAGGIEAVTTALRAHGRSAGVARAGSSALLALASHGANTARCCTAGGIDAVLTAMRAHPHNDSVAEAAVGVLALLCYNETQRAAACAGGAIPAVIAAMHLDRQRGGSGLCLARGCAALYALLGLQAGRAAAVAAMVRDGATHAVVAAMRRHAASAPLQLHGCALLEALTGKAVRGSAVTDAEAGAVEVVADALRLGASTSSPLAGGAGGSGDALLERSCMCLSTLVRTRADQQRCSDAGIVGALVGALRSHGVGAAAIGPTALPIAICSAISVVCARFDTAQVAFSAAGGIDALVACIRAHDTSDAVTEAGAKALASAVTTPDSDVATALEDAGGIEVTVAQMEMHAASPGVQAAGCAVIAALAGGDEHRVLALRCGALEACLLALRAHSRAENVAEMGTAALWNLAYCPAVEKRIADAGGADAVVAASRAFRRNERVQASCCGLLACLSFNDDTKAGVLHSGAVEAVVTAMRSHRKSAPVCEQGSQALWNLTAYEDHALDVAACGGIDAVVGAMQAHPANGLVQEACCACLCNFACNPGHADSLDACGAQQAVKDAMRAHEGHPGVQDQGARALVVFASNVMASTFEAAAAASAEAGNTGGVKPRGASREQPAGGETPSRKSAFSAGPAGEPGTASALKWALSDPELFAHQCLRARDRAVHAVKRAAMLKDGAADVVCKGMSIYLTSPAVQQAGCRALANLALGDVRNVLSTSGASSAVIEASVAAMRAHPADETVVEYSCWTLAYITWTSQEAKLYAREVGAPVLLKAALARFPKVDGVQKQAKLALWKISDTSAA